MLEVADIERDNTYSFQDHSPQTMRDENRRSTRNLVASKYLFEGLFRGRSRQSWRMSLTDDLGSS